MVFINFVVSEHWLFTSAYLFAYCYHQIIDFLLNTLFDYNIHSSAQNIRMFSTHTMILITISIVMCKTLNAMTHEIVLIIISIVITQIIGYFYSNNCFLFYRHGMLFHVVRQKKLHAWLNFSLKLRSDEISFAFFQRLFTDGNNFKSHILAWCNSRFKEQKRMLLNTLTFSQR